MADVSLTLSQAFDIALKAYNAGSLTEAEQICLRIISADPDSAATLNLLAVIYNSLGRNDLALSSYDRALSLRPDFIQAWNNRGAVLKQMQRFDEALESYDRALDLQPDYAEVLNKTAPRGPGGLRPRAGLAAGLCRSAQQPWHRPAGLGTA
jgi:Tfp pilus assembly protein PilF